MTCFFLKKSRLNRRLDGWALSFSLNFGIKWGCYAFVENFVKLEENHIMFLLQDGSSRSKKSFLGSQLERKEENHFWSYFLIHEGCGKLLGDILASIKISGRLDDYDYYFKDCFERINHNVWLKKVKMVCSMIHKTGRVLIAPYPVDTPERLEFSYTYGWYPPFGYQHSDKRILIN